MDFKRFTLIYFCLFVSFALQSQKPLTDFIDNPILENANISLQVKDLKTNKILYNYRAENSAVPASTMKLVSTATALEMLGADFKFTTTLEIDGELRDSVLNGNLIIRGGGDPTLGSDKCGKRDFLGDWTLAVRKAGIKKINGRIIANTSIFDHQVINPRWIWEDMGNYYAPGIHGISYLDNTFKLYLRSGKPGMRTEVIKTEPEIGRLSFQNYVVSANISYDNAYFYGEPFSNSRTLFGEIPANKNEFVVKGDIPNPGLLLAEHFHAALNNIGIQVEETPVVDLFDIKARKVIYTHYSVPLSEIITETNVKSNNHYAEYLFKYLGASKNNAASNKAAIKAIRVFWNQRGLSIDQLFQNDGSGLSPGNAVSAQFFVELLSYMRTNSKHSDIFYKSLAVSGVSGTLSSFLYKSSLKGRVYAKSGTIERVKSYAGYLHSGNDVYVFCILVNNANGTSWSVQQQIEKFLIEINL